MEAGSCLVLVFNPLWVIKTRMTLQGAEPSARQYKSVTDAFATIIREEGVQGLYRGLVPAMLLTSHGAIQFAVYEQLKSWGRTPAAGAPQSDVPLEGLETDCAAATKEPSSKRPVSCRYHLNRDQATALIARLFFCARQSAPQSMMFGALSKIIATSATYPYQVVKSRLQQGDMLTPRVALAAASSSSSSSSTTTAAVPAATSFAPVAPKYTGTIDCLVKIWRYVVYLSLPLSPPLI